MLAREHNDANVISVGGRMHTVEDMTRFVEVFLATAFSGEERHARRIEMLAAYEKTGNLPPLPDSALGHRPAAPADDARGAHPLPARRTPARPLRRPRRAVDQPAGPVRRVRRRCSTAPGW